MSTITTRAGKGSPLTNNEVDANFTNLNTDKAELSGATFTGDVTSTGFSGDITGAVLFQAKAGEAFTKGDPVYISGISGNTTVVSKADANDANKMPCFGIVDATVSINANCSIVTFGTLSNLNTSAFSEGDELYISDTGTLSSTAPTGEASQLQKIAKVTRAHASAGSIKVMGAGRTNATPNLNDGKFFLGNSSNQSASATFSTSVTDIALPLSGGAMTGAITTNSTFDGRDVATDGTKLDGIEASADVTDTANVTAAGALMDSELTSIASVKALNQGVATTDSPTFVDVTATSLDISGDIDVDGTTNLDVVDIDGAVDMASTLTVTGEITANGGIALGDNDKATFGASDDLEIYHNGSDSFVSDVGTGDLYLQGSSNIYFRKGNGGEVFAHFADDGACKLRFDNSTKLATTSTGIDVTGTATMDGLTVGGTSAYPTTTLSRDGGSAGTQGYLTTGFSAIGYSGGTGADTYMVSEHGFGFAVNAGTTALTITDTGRVGIGNSAPLGKLTISNAAGTNAPSTVTAANTYLQLGSDDYGPSNNGKFMIGFGFTDATNTNSPAYIGYEEASTSGDTYGDLTFYTRSVTTDTAPTERMRISSAGRVGIGVSPSATLDIAGDNQYNRISSYFSGSYTSGFKFSDLNGGIWYDAGTDDLTVSAGHANSQLILESGGSERMKIRSDGYVDIAGASDLRLTLGSQGTAGNNDSNWIRGNGTSLSYNAASANHIWETGGSEKMRLSGSTLDVGRGTVADATVLIDSASGGDPTLVFDTGATNRSAVIRFKDQGVFSGFINYHHQYDRMDFGSGSSTTIGMSLTSGGILLLGKTSTNVNVAGGYIGGGEAIMSISSGANTYLVRNTSTSTYSFYVSGAGQIHAVQTSISSLSDERLKENIVDLDTGLDEVMALKPRKFDWKEGEGSGEKNVTGFIAQEVETVLPNLIGDFEHDDLNDAKSVKMGDMVPTLVKAIQEQQTLIESLTARIAALEE